MPQQRQLREVRSEAEDALPCGFQRRHRINNLEGQNPANRCYRNRFFIKQGAVLVEVSAWLIHKNRRLV